MAYADPAQSNQNTETIILGDVYAVCSAAQRFFQQAAQQVGDSNLRYKFLQLSALHSAAAQNLPVADTAQLRHGSDELAAIQFWYLHQHAVLHNQPLQQTTLAELTNLLQQQLGALKQLTKTVHSHTARVTLAHLSAALQIASDQLLPLLKVLPDSRQKIQTKN